MTPTLSSVANNPAPALTAEHNSKDFSPEQLANNAKTNKDSELLQRVQDRNEANSTSESE